MLQPVPLAGCGARSCGPGPSRNDGSTAQPQTCSVDYGLPQDLAPCCSVLVIKFISVIPFAFFWFLPH